MSHIFSQPVLFDCVCRQSKLTAIVVVEYYHASEKKNSPKKEENEIRENHSHRIIFQLLIIITMFISFLSESSITRRFHIYYVSSFFSLSSFACRSLSITEFSVRFSISHLLSYAIIVVVVCYFRSSSRSYLKLHRISVRACVYFYIRIVYFVWVSQFRLSLTCNNNKKVIQNVNKVKLLV